MQMFSSFLRYIQRYEEVTAASKQMVNNTAYGANSGSLQTFTLPATAQTGDRITLVGIGAGGWTIAQNASQLIRSGATVSTTGVTGSVSSSQGMSIEIVCVVTNTTWIVVASNGSLTFA